MADEFRNKVAPEFNPQSENKVIKENLFAKENKPVSEIVTAKETLDTTQNRPQPGKLNKAKKNQAIGALSAGLVGTIALVLTTMTSLVNVKMKAKIDQEKLLYEDGVIKYTVYVESMTEKETLTLYPSQDNKAMPKIPLEDPDGDGVIEGQIEVDNEYIANKLASKPNVIVTYGFKLKGMVGLDIERPFDSCGIKIEKQTSEFDSVAYHCECGVDGYFYFTMNFSDDNQLFTDWEAWIEDAFYEDAITTSEKAQHTAKCDLTENLHDEQRIFVDGLTGSAGTLFIKYKANGVDTYVVKDGTTTEKAGISINM